MTQKDSVSVSHYRVRQPMQFNHIVHKYLCYGKGYIRMLQWYEMSKLTKPVDYHQYDTVSL